MENKFNEIKEEILRRAHEASACEEQYRRAYKSDTLAELMQVVKDNFRWCCNENVLAPDLIEKYREEFAAHDIFCNVSIRSGYLLACDNATVEAWDNATVEAWDNATVRAYGNATVRAWDNATVEAWDNATVEAWDNATVEAWDNAYCSSLYLLECKLSDNAIYRVRSTNTVYFANDGINFKKQENNENK